jgi:putative DNA primase/helicase
MDKGCRPKATKRDGQVPWRGSTTDLPATAGSAIPANGRAPHPRACAISTSLTAQPRLLPAKPRPVASDDVTTNIALAWCVWYEGHDPRGTVDHAYLRRGKLVLPEGLPSRGLHYHPALKFNGAVGLGMVVLLCAMVTNEPCGLHQTVLDRDSSRLGRQMLGRAQHAAIKLNADDAVTLGLLTAGRLEIGLAAHHACLRPVWALASTGAIVGFPAPHAIEAINMLPKVNHGRANRREAHACAARRMAAGKEELVIAARFAGDVADRWCELV